MSHASRLHPFRGVSGHPLDRVMLLVRDGWEAVEAELRRRADIAALREAEDRMLADIGVERGGIEAAVLHGRR